MPTLSFKVSPLEAKIIRRIARNQNATISDYLRTVAIPKHPTRTRKRILKKHPVSGLVVDVTPGPVVTMEEIKEALADFP